MWFFPKLNLVSAEAVLERTVEFAGLFITPVPTYHLIVVPYSDMLLNKLERMLLRVFMDRVEEVVLSAAKKH